MCYMHHRIINLMFSNRAIRWSEITTERRFYFAWNIFDLIMWLLHIMVVYIFNNNLENLGQIVIYLTCSNICVHE